ncbi:MAG: toxic anion resistance protein [Actinomycetota bacterium]
MTDLDLASSPVPVAAPTARASGTLVLAPPAAVIVVNDEQAAGAIPIESGKQVELRSKANAFVTELAAMDTKSPVFTQKVSSITSMGEQDMRSAAAVSSRMLERPALGRGNQKDDAQTRVSNTLVDLRTTVTDLDPKRADLTGVKKLLKFMPGGDKVDRYFARYQSAQSHLNAIIKALDSGQDELRKDNASIETEKANMWTTMGKLSEYNELASALDGALGNKVAELDAGGQTEEANILRADALFPVRQRRQDIMTQMAVNVQGYMALDLVRKNNLELIRGVDRAQTTTISALRTAVIVSQALSRQKLVLDQISALNTVTSNLIESTSEQLRIQGAQINQQAATSTIDIAKLQAAFDNVFATMDALDTFRAQAVDSMGETVTALEGQMARAKPYLERTRRGEINA